MKIISLVLLVIGMLLCVAGSFGTHFFVFRVMHDAMHMETAGVGNFVNNITNAWYLSFISIAGSACIFIGLIFNVIAMFKEKKQQAQ